MSRSSDILSRRATSTSASAANAAIAYLCDRVFGTADREFASMVIPAPESNSYGIAPASSSLSPVPSTQAVPSASWTAWASPHPS
jgi:hypothetical protein